MVKKSFKEFYDDLIPFKNYVAYRSDFRKFRFTKDDFFSFANEKIWNIYLRYNGTLNYNSLLTLAKTSLYKLPLYLNREYGKLTFLEVTQEGVNPVELISQEESISNDYTVQAKVVLEWGWGSIPPEKQDLLEVILNPPPFVLSKVKVGYRKIPPKLFLEFLGVSPSTHNERAFIRFRKKVWEDLQAFTPVYKLEHPGKLDSL